MLVGFVFFAVLAASPVVAEMRVSTVRFLSICRVVIVVDNHHGRKLVYDGRLHRGRIFKVNAGGGSLVCVSRTYNPNDCRTAMTPWRCKSDRSNRSIVFNVS